MSNLPSRPNLLLDSTFKYPIGAYWVQEQGQNWTISSGTASVVGTIVTFLANYASMYYPTKTYALTYEVTTITSGAVRPYLDGTGYFSYYATTPGKYTTLFTPTSPNPTFKFVGTAGDIYTIKNVFIHEVGGTSQSDGFIYTPDSTYEDYRKIQDLTPLHHWRLNEQSGGVANDCGSSPIAGSITSVTLNQSGKIDKSAFFLGTSTSYIDCGINSCNFVNENFTVCYWMNCATITAEVVVLGNGQSAAKGWYMENTSGNIQLKVNNTAARFVRGGSLTVSTWTHIAASKYNSTGTLYQNGTEITTYAARENISSITSSDLPFLIGKYGPQVGYDYRGYLEDVRIYDRALTQQEIQQIYNLGRGTYDHSWKSGFPTVKPPIHHWKLNDATNSVLALDSGSVPIAGSNTSIGGYLQAGFQNNSYSMLFTGTASYIRCPVTDFGAIKGMSWWTKPNAGNVQFINLFRRASGGINGFAIGWYDPSGIFYQENTGTAWASYVSYGQGMTTTAWSHWALSRSSANIMSLFFNGTLVASQQVENINNVLCTGTALEIGYTQYNGYLSDIRVYDYALSSDEVRNLYNLGRGVYHLT